MTAIEFLKSIGYDNNSITKTELFIAESAISEIMKLKEENKNLRLFIPDNTPATWMGVLKKRYEEIDFLHEECKRLHKVAEFWQQKYNEQSQGWKQPTIDNNPLA